MNKKTLLVVVGLLVMLLTLSSCASTNPETPIVDGKGDIFEKGVYLVAWVMDGIGTFFFGSLGVAIILTTLLVRTLAWPIYSSMSNISIKMALMQPAMQQVEEKYAGKRDPESERKKAMEMQKVMGDLKIMRSMLGCIPSMIAQFAIFHIMYATVARIGAEGGDFAADLNTTFLGFIDLADGGFFSSFGQILLLVLVGSSMWILQIQTQKKPSYMRNVQVKNAKQQEQEQMQKIMRYFMVGMFVFYSARSNALALYWIAGNVHSIINTNVNRVLNEKKYVKLKGDK